MHTMLKIFMCFHHISDRELTMNSVIEAINKRYSTRAYETEPVPKELINAIIEAGNQAPFTSVTRSQPWRFVVVQDPDFKQKLFQTAFPFWKNATDGMKEKYPELYEMATCLYNAMSKPKDVIYYNAPVIIFVIGPSTGGAVSCALACENMMIAATSFGLGSCYTGFGAMVKGNPEIVEALARTQLKGNILEQQCSGIIFGNLTDLK